MNEADENYQKIWNFVDDEDVCAFVSGGPGTKTFTEPVNVNELANFVWIREKNDFKSNCINKKLVETSHSTGNSKILSAILSSVLTV